MDPIVPVAEMTLGSAPEQETPAIRKELFFRPRTNDLATVLVEDPITGTFFETDRDTARLAQLLDGTVTLEEALATLHALDEAASINAEMLPQIHAELTRMGLLADDDPGKPRPRKPPRFGMVAQRIRIGAGDRTFGALTKYFGWTHSWVGALICIVLMVLGGANLVENQERFGNDLNGLLSYNGVLYLWLAWLLTKAWHEFQHGIVTKLYGIEVREVGVLLILFVPLGAYVDASAVWRLDSRWRRFHVTAAGVLGEFALAGAALIWWASLPTGELSIFLQAVIIAATISSVIFNMNPLMRFDGYYALVDALDAKNLYERGMMSVRGSLLRILTGQSPGIGEGGFVLVYGWLALLWRYVVAVSLVLIASQLAFGFGAVLGAVVIWTLIFVPLGRFLKSLGRMGVGPVFRAALRTTALALVAAGALFIPLPDRMTAPGLVEYAQRTEVRTDAPGQIVEIGVDTQDRVGAEELVMRLENPALQADIARLRAALARQQTLLSSALAAKTIGERQRIDEEMRSTREELAEAEYRFSGLEVRAPHRGVVLTPDIPERQGRWLARGDIAFEVGDPDSYEIEAWLTRDDLDRTTRTETALTFRPETFGAEDIQVELVRFEPRAALSLPPPALTTEGGGPLAIATEGTERSLLTPRFLVILRPLQPPDGWIPGLPGTVSSEPDWRTGWSYLTEMMEDIHLSDPARWASVTG